MKLPTIPLLLTIVAVVVLLAGTRPVVSWLSRPLIESDPLRPVDAIVVLGAGAHDATTLTAETAYRLVYGLQLFKGGYAPLVILSGGGHRHTKVSDAQAMANVAVALGAPAASLVLDPDSSSTSAQARSVARIARERRIRSIALVTSPLHSYRAGRAFRRVGLEVVAAPGISDLGAAPRTILVAQDHLVGRLGTLGRALYEYGALLDYWRKGAI